MNHRSLFAGSLAIVFVLMIAAVLNAQGQGNAAAGQPLAAPAFDETVIVSVGSPSVGLAIPASVVAAFENAIVDVQVLEPPGPFGRATTNFLTVDDGFGNFSPVPLLWSRFGTSITVLPSDFGTLAAGQEIRVRIWIHR